MQVAFPLSKATDSTSSLHTAENSTTPTRSPVVPMSTPSPVSPSSTDPTTVVAPTSATPSTPPPQLTVPMPTTPPTTTKKPVTTASNTVAPSTMKPSPNSVAPTATPSVTPVPSSKFPTPRTASSPALTSQATTNNLGTSATLTFTPPPPQPDVTGLDNALSDWNNSATFVPTHVQIDTTVANPSNNQAMLIAIIACASLALFLVAFFVVLYVRRARRGSESNDRTRRGDDEGYLGTPPPSTFNRTSQHPRNQRQPPQLSPRQRQHLSKLSPRSFLHHSQPTPTSTSNASYMLPSPVNFILDHPGGNGVEYNNSFTRTAMANRSFAVDDIRDNNSAGSYQSDSAKGYFDLRLSTPAGSSGRSLSFSYRITSPEASMPLSSVSPRSVNSDLAMLDDDHRRSSGESSNFSIRVDSKEDLTADGNNDDLDGSSDHVTQLHDDGDRMKTAIDHQARRTSSVSSDLSSYHI